MKRCGERGVVCPLRALVADNSDLFGHIITMKHGVPTSIRPKQRPHQSVGCVCQKFVNSHISEDASLRYLMFEEQGLKSKILRFSTWATLPKYGSGPYDIGRQRRLVDERRDTKTMQVSWLEGILCTFCAKKPSLLARKMPHYRSVSSQTRQIINFTDPELRARTSGLILLRRTWPACWSQL